MLYLRKTNKKNSRVLTQIPSDQLITCYLYAYIVQHNNIRIIIELAVL